MSQVSPMKSPSKLDQLRALRETKANPVPGSALLKYDAMCRAIDAAYDVDEVKDIRDQAIALEHYARQAKNVEAERRACEIRLRAERKAGQLRANEKKAPAGRPRKNGKNNPPPSGGRISTNAERREQLGISKKQDEQWQKLGAIPQEDFDHAIAESEKPTTAGIIRANAEPKQKPVSKDARWLWGRLRDFHSSGMLDKDPRDVMLTMTDQMRDQVHVFAPRLAAWLKRIGAVAS